jgi:hypothetical protein
MGMLGSGSGDGGRRRRRRRRRVGICICSSCHGGHQLFWQSLVVIANVVPYINFISCAQSPDAGRLHGQRRY